MYFKKELTIRQVAIENRMLEMDLGGPHKIKMVLRVPTEGEKKVGHLDYNPFCDVSGEWPVKPNFLEAFQMIANNKMPQGSKEQDHWNIYGIDTDGHFKERLYLPIHFLPDPLASFIEQADNELMDYARRTINLLRWRSGTEGYHDPISIRVSSWSLDGENWYPTPSSSRAHVSSFPYIRTNEEVLNDVKSYLSQNKDQSLGHDLFLEAWEQRFSNPRSSLIVGIAAAETALKHCISESVPEARWLVENVASPDFVKMLSEYFPLLPMAKRVSKDIFKQKAYIYETLKKGVQIRNLIVHGRATTVNIDTLEQILVAVYDVLWIIDYCSGYEWVIRYMSQDIQKVLREG